MNIEQYLLICLAEECAEIQQRVSKALRFTSEEIQPGQGLSSAQRIEMEIVDFLGVLELLVEMGVIEDPRQVRVGIEEKKAKVAKFAEYSRDRGVLQESELRKESAA